MRPLGQMHISHVQYHALAGPHCFLGICGVLPVRKRCAAEDNQPGSDRRLAVMATETGHAVLFENKSANRLQETASVGK